MSLDQAIDNAIASVEMEGLTVDEQCKEWCRRLLNKEITMDEYILMVKQQAGVVA